MAGIYNIVIMMKKTHTTQTGENNMTTLLDLNDDTTTAMLDAIMNGETAEEAMNLETPQETEGDDFDLLAYLLSDKEVIIGEEVEEEPTDEEKRISGIIEDLKEQIIECQNLINDWSNREYKTNNGSVAVGYDTMTEKRMNVSDINENRRYRTILNLKERIVDLNDDIEFWEMKI